ncbi:MAG: hypothetical protein ABI718_00580 [Acidobacteriota bacterium]
MTRPALRIPTVAALAAVALLVFAPAAMACPVCFGAAAGSQAAKSMNYAILFLLAVVGLVQIGFATLFWSFWRRSREFSMKPEPFVLIEGGRP